MRKAVVPLFLLVIVALVAMVAGMLNLCGVRKRRGGTDDGVGSINIVAVVSVFLFLG